MKSLSSKDLIVFDLDGTLTPKARHPSRKICRIRLLPLLKAKKVAVIGGGSYDQFKDQLLGHFACPPKLFANFFPFSDDLHLFLSIRARWLEKSISKSIKAREKRKRL